MAMNDKWQIRLTEQAQALIRRLNDRRLMTLRGGQGQRVVKRAQGPDVAVGPHKRRMRLPARVVLYSASGWRRMKTGQNRMQHDAT